MWGIIENLIKNEGLNINQFSLKVGISSQVLYRWKDGSSKPSIDMLDKVAKYFNVPVSYLLGEKEEDIKKGYWLNEETAKIAQEIFNNKELKLLFNSAKDSSPEDLKVVHEMLLALKRKEVR